MFKSAPDRRFPTPEEMKDHKYGYADIAVAPREIAKFSD
jgi:hypothetical protein